MSLSWVNWIRDSVPRRSLLCCVHHHGQWEWWTFTNFCFLHIIFVLASRQEMILQMWMRRAGSIHTVHHCSIEPGLVRTQMIKWMSWGWLCGFHFSLALTMIRFEVSDALLGGNRGVWELSKRQMSVWNWTHKKFKLPSQTRWKMFGARNLRTFAKLEDSQSRAISWLKVPTSPFTLDTINIPC